MLVRKNACVVGMLDIFRVFFWDFIAEGIKLRA